MESIASNSIFLRAFRMLLTAGARIVVLGATLVEAGCIIVPVPSVTPDNETGIIYEATLESLIGLDQEEVNERIGQPDFSSPRGHSYMMVYQGEKHYSTDVYVVVGGGGGGGAAKIDSVMSKVLVCFVIELNEHRVVQDYEVIVPITGGITARDSSDYTVEPIIDCSEVVWKPDERKKILAANREAMIAELEVRAGHGDTEAIIELAGITGNLGPLEALAKEGDLTVAFAVYKQLSQEAETATDAWRWLCLAANGGHEGAQRNVANWHRILTWQSGIERLRWLRDEVGIQPDNRVAYMWYTLAASSGKEYVAAVMTPDEVAQAEQMVRDWKPGDCPSAEHRLGMPGKT